jgi:NADPH-dependent 2,4-dienoyl-CoA reductase/sulfur reductase-like enzyme
MAVHPTLKEPPCNDAISCCRPLPAACCCPLAWCWPTTTGRSLPRRPKPPKGGGGTPPANPKARVIVVGGGMAGATVAKYLRLWGDAVDVTLIERSAQYTSNIMSSMVLTGQRSMASLGFGYGTLQSAYGVRLVTGDVVEIDPVGVRVRWPPAPGWRPTASCWPRASASTPCRAWTMPAACRTPGRPARRPACWPSSWLPCRPTAWWC